VKKKERMQEKTNQMPNTEENPRLIFPKDYKHDYPPQFPSQIKIRTIFFFCDVFRIKHERYLKNVTQKEKDVTIATANTTPKNTRPQRLVQDHSRDPKNEFYTQMENVLEI
jgi:hypothetical protein